MGLEMYDTKLPCPRCGYCYLEVVSTCFGKALKCSMCLYGRDDCQEFEFDIINVR